MAVCEGLGTRLKLLEASTLVTCKVAHKFELTTSDDLFNDAYRLVVPGNQIAFVEYEVACRQGDGTERAAFKRVALYYRDGGSVQIQRFWHTLFTVRSVPDFDVDFQLEPDAVQFRVKAATSQDTFWIGCVHVAFVG